MIQAKESQIDIDLQMAKDIDPVQCALCGGL